MNQPIKNSQVVRQVTKAELPISCPTNDKESWSEHPRVFLPLSDDNKTEVCPYCSAQFTLVEANT